MKDWDRGRETGDMELREGERLADSVERLANRTSEE